MIEIPLTSDGEQFFRIKLDGDTYDFRVLFNTRVNTWAVDISLNGAEIINGVTLVIGTNLLSRYNIPPVNLYMFNITVDGVDATGDTLGSNVRMFKPTIDEVASVATV